MLGWSGGLRTDQLKVKRNCDPARDLVLQSKQIVSVAVEPLRPQMCVGLGIDELGGNADLVAARWTLPSRT